MERILILSYHQAPLCFYTCKNIRKAVFDYPRDDRLAISDKPDDLLTYQLTSVESCVLRQEFSFSLGAAIPGEFEKLKFKRQKTHRRYPPGGMYT